MALQQSADDFGVGAMSPSVVVPAGEVSVVDLGGATEVVRVDVIDLASGGWHDASGVGAVGGGHQDRVA